GSYERADRTLWRIGAHAPGLTRQHPALVACAIGIVTAGCNRCSQLFPAEQNMIALLAAFCIITAGVSAALAWPLIRRGQHKQATVIALLLVIASGGLYALLGSPAVIDVAKKRQMRIETLAPRIAELSKQLQDNPNNADGWAELGQALFIAEQ